MKPPSGTEMFLKQALYVGYTDCSVLNFKITTALPRAIRFGAQRAYPGEAIAIRGALEFGLATSVVQRKRSGTTARKLQAEAHRAIVYCQISARS